MARIERVNYDTYIKPLEHIQKAHNDTLADMANMSQQSEILDYYLDPELDKESYNLYNNFKNEFNAQATDFAQNGYTRNNGARLLNLHRNYNRNVGNVLDAVKNREAERAEQHKLFADSNGQVVFGNGQNADEKSVDDYLRGNKGYVFQNLDEVYKYAKNQAAAASKREYKDGVRDAVRVLDNNYYKILEETGYNTQAAYEKLDAMMADVANQLDLTYNPNNDPNIDPKNDPAGLIRNMREELRRRGLENYSNEDKHKIISSFLTGTYEGLGYEPKLTSKETEQMAKAGRANTNVVIKTGERPLPKSNQEYDYDNFTLKSQKEINTANLTSKWNSLTGKESTALSPIVARKKLPNGKYINGLATFDEYMTNLGFKKDEYGKYGLKINIDGRANNPVNTESYRTQWNNILNEIEQTFFLKKGSDGGHGADVKTMTNPQTEDEAIERYLGKKYYRLQKVGDGVTQRTYRLNINNPKDVVYKMLTSNQVGATWNLQYDPVDNVYTTDKQFDKDDVINYLRNSDVPDAEKNNIRIGIVYAPMNDDLFQVEVTPPSNSMNDGNPIYFPVTELISARGKKLLQTPYKNYKSAENKLKTSLDVLSNGELSELDEDEYIEAYINNFDNPDQTEQKLITNIKQALRMRQYWRNEILHTINKQAEHNIKSWVRDETTSPSLQDENGNILPQQTTEG